MRAQPGGGAGFVCIVDRHADDQAQLACLLCLPARCLANMDPVRSPASRLRWRSGKQQHQPPDAGNPGQAAHQSPAIPGRTQVIAHHDSAAGRQMRGQGDGAIPQPHIGEQPAKREVQGVAPRHGSFYRRRHKGRNAAFRKDIR